GCIRGGNQGADGSGGEREGQSAGLRAPQASAAAVARASASRAHHLSRTFGLPLLRRDLAQDRRGCDGDAGAGPAPVESDPARAREVLLPVLRKHYPAASAVASNRARTRRAGTARAWWTHSICPGRSPEPCAREMGEQVRAPGLRKPSSGAN